MAMHARINHTWMLRNQSRHCLNHFTRHGDRVFGLTHSQKINEQVKVTFCRFLEMDGELNEGSIATLEVTNRSFEKIQRQ
jgi:hypothetical protein